MKAQSATRASCERVDVSQLNLGQIGALRWGRLLTHEPISKWSSHHNPRCLKNLQYTRNARKAEDSAVKNHKVKLICGPKSVDGGSRLKTLVESSVSVTFLAAIIALFTVLLQKLPFCEDGVGEKLDVGDLVVDMPRSDMRRWALARQ